MTAVRMTHTGDPRPRATSMAPSMITCEAHIVIAIPSQGAFWVAELVSMRQRWLSQLWPGCCEDAGSASQIAVSKRSCHQRTR